VYYYYCQLPNGCSVKVVVRLPRQYYFYFKCQSYLSIKSAQLLSHKCIFIVWYCYPPQGAVKITPAHDFNDYDVGKRHNLPFVEMINEDGLITDVCEQFKVRQTKDWSGGGTDCTVHVQNASMQVLGVAILVSIKLLFSLQILY